MYPRLQRVFGIPVFLQKEMPYFLPFVDERRSVCLGFSGRLSFLSRLSSSPSSRFFISPQAFARLPPDEKEVESLRISTCLMYFRLCTSQNVFREIATFLRTRFIQCGHIYEQLRHAYLRRQQVGTRWFVFHLYTNSRYEGVYLCQILSISIFVKRNLSEILIH